MSEENRPPEQDLPRPKGRLPFAQTPSRGAMRSSALFVYGGLVATLIGVALYMALVVGHPLTSAYVAGPGIGAMWFALRLFMVWGSKD